MSEKVYRIDFDKKGNDWHYLQTIISQGKVIGNKPYTKAQLDNIEVGHDNGCPAIEGGKCGCVPDLYIPKKPDGRGGKDKW